MYNPFAKSEKTNTQQHNDVVLRALDQTALVIMLDKEGRIIFVNDLFVSISKYTREELIGQNHSIFDFKNQNSEFFVNLRKIISHGDIWRGDMQNKAKDGTLYWTDTSIVPIRNTSNEVKQYVIICLVITGDKQAELDVERTNEELKKTKMAMLNIMEDIDQERKRYLKQSLETKKFAQVVENASENIIISDAKGTVLYANKAITKFTGYSHDEIIGKKAGGRDLWGGQMEEEFYKRMWHTIKIDKKSFRSEINNRRKDGSTYVAAITISPILNHDGEVEFYAGIGRDITREKNIDQMKTDFISLASHQLRTPLSSMKWFLEMLLEGDAGELDPEQREYVSNIDQSNERMIALVNGLLNISRIESGRIIVDPVETDLHQLIDDVVKEIRPQFDKKKQLITVSTHPSLPKVMLDPKLIRNVYMNFLTNANKYSPEGGEVSVFVSLKQDQVISQISDSGYGIPKAEQEKLFQRFFRATNILKTDTNGTGLGLYLAKAIVDSSGGKIWFESEEGKGATFWFSLPVQGMRAKKGEVTLDS